MARTPRRPTPQRLHEAAWPDMLANLQSAYRELARAQLELQRQADQIGEARDLFQLVVESMSEALFLLDHAGRVVRSNPAARALLGHSEEELAGRPLQELWGVDELPITPLALLERAPAGVLPVECEVRARGGHSIPVSASCVIVRDQRGKIVGTLVVARDVTERRRAEEAQRFLAEASRLLSASLDYGETLDGLVRAIVPALADWCSIDLLGAEGGARRAAFAHREPAKEPLVRRLLEHYPPAADEAQPVSKVLRTGQPLLISDISEARLRETSRDAEQLALRCEVGFRSVMVVPLTARGSLLGAVTFVGNDTRRRYDAADLALAMDLADRAALALENARLYREAQEAVRARDEFLSIASHELRTPVTGLRGAAQLLLRQLERGMHDEARLERSLRTIDAAAGRLTRMIADLLDTSRLQSGQLGLRRRPVDVAALLREVLPQWHERFGERHPLVTSGLDEPAIIEADPDRLEQVVANLLDNAAKYSPEGGSIYLSLACDGLGVRLAVEDRGIGLPPGAEEAIFGPFGRARNAAEQHIQGLGLGLYICRQIVEAHGGWIRAVSAGEGRGTTVTIWLPA